MKKCNKCDNERELSDFYTGRGYKDGIRPVCKICLRAERNARYLKDPTKVSVQQKEWVKANRSRRLKIMRDWNLKVKYGITPEQFDEMVKAQNGCCKICEKPQDRVLHVDHCHETGKIRGLLCSTCNTGIGQFKEDPEIMKKAIEYINETR